MRQAADDGLRGGSRLSHLLQRDALVALRQPDAVVSQDERHMCERRRGRSERPVEQELADGRGEKIIAAHDLGDLHGDVVDDRGELVGGYAVRPPHDEIADRSGLRSVSSVHAVHEVRHVRLFHAEPPRMRASRSDPQLDLVRLEIATGAGIHRLVSRCLGRARRRLDVLAAAKARVDEPRRAQRCKRRVVVGAPLRLRVGFVRSWSLRTFIPIQAEPAQVEDDALGGTGHHAEPVEVLET